MQVQSPRQTVAQTRRRCAQRAVCQAVSDDYARARALSRPSPMRAIGRARTSERLTFRHHRRFPARLGEVRFSLTAAAEARDNRESIVCRARSDVALLLKRATLAQTL